MSVKRYACYVIEWDGSRNEARQAMVAAELGPYVLYTDYAELEKRVFEMQNAAIDLAMQNKALKAKLDAYRSKTEGDK